MIRNTFFFGSCALAGLFLTSACGDDDGGGDDSDSGTETSTTTASSTSTTDPSTSSTTDDSASSTSTTSTTTDGTSTTGDTEGTGTTGGDAAEPGMAGGSFAPLGAYTDLTGSALIVRRTDGTDVSIQISGLTADTDYPAHVHAQACADEDGGGHYKIDPSIDDTQEANELWPAFTSDQNGNGRVEITTTHLARPDALSVVVHDPAADNAKMACADLTVPNPVDPYVISDANVTVLQAATDAGFGGMTATASIERSIDGSTTVNLSVTGLDNDATYPVHVHETNCTVAAGSGHYKIDYGIMGTEENNELWAPVTTDGTGAGTSMYTVDDHIARAEAQSIVVHGDGGGNPRFACIDLEP